MYVNNKLIVYLFSALFLFKATAQELLPIVAFSPKDYGADNQIWSISQSEEQYVYAANGQGLLEFNGSAWKLYTVPNNSIIRSVKAFQGKIFTGCFKDFGYWERDVFGDLKYTSLPQSFDLNMQDDEEFWNITELDGWMIFQSLSNIYLLNLKEKTSKIIQSDAQIFKMWNFEETIFFQKTGIGLFKIENGNVILVNNSDELKQNQIIDIFKLGRRTLILTDNSGIFYLNANQLEQWNIDERIDLANLRFYSAKQLKDETLLLGTISSGLFHLDKNGILIENYSQNNGLNNNTVLSIFEDIHNNIWLGLDYGINFINRNSKFRIYNNTDGSLGTVYNAINYKEILYLGTNQGLFFRRIDEDDNFKLIEGSKGQVWSLKIIDGQLFCGHNNGTFIIENGRIARTIYDAIGTWDFKLFPDNPNKILQGNYKGLNTLEKTNAGWQYQNRIEGTDMSSRFFELFNDQIFVNHEFKGLYELNFMNNTNKVQSLDISNTVEKGIGSSLLKFSGDLIYSSSEGIFRYDENSKFVKDTLFSSLFSPYESLSTLLEIHGESNKFWRFADDNIIIVSPGSVTPDPQIEVFPISEKLRNVVAGFENLSKIGNDDYLIGTSNGYIIYNRSIPDPIVEFNISLNSVEANKLNESSNKLNILSDNELDNEVNNIAVSYSMPYFGDIVNAKYQYRLVGLSDIWSEWTTESSQVFKNLSFGEYTFNVRGKIGDNLSENIVSFRFNIERPWFLTNLAIALYCLMGLIIIIIIHNFYKSYYVNQQQRLLKDAERKIEVNELANSQKLMELKNEKLKQDIENKNRELAISTMSLIKKNEFLNNIKNELKTADNPKIKSVIQLINKNVNNTDDWHFFEEAFNNADKDFLKKIKILHPELTPNDLKLCAYLRLNLSSKEIAPLLNISSRSVEVKRYRLRKKMDLPHAYSLTNYILEV
ncbi:MAG: LuxR family transcriptional regulator [Bacteroidia bacterium]|nr:LuxR family transcriptional regulator [Bacteroidia bacterium]